MVGSGMFNFRDCNKLWEEIGDLFQPEPVFDYWIFENLADGYTTLATNFWQQCFQREDKDFAGTLNRIREGRHTEADTEVLKRRILVRNIRVIKLKAGFLNLMWLISKQRHVYLCHSLF